MNKPPVEEKFPDESLLNRSKFSYKIDCYIIFIESGKRLVANAKRQKYCKFDCNYGREYIFLASPLCLGPVLLIAAYYPANIYSFNGNNRNSRKKCETCSKLAIKTPDRSQ